MNTQKVMHITTGLNDGGAEATLYRLVCADDATRHHVVSLMGLGKYGQLLLDAGASVTCLDMRRGALSLRGIWVLRRLLVDTHPDVVQTWMYHGDLLGGVVARLCNVRRICWGIHHTVLESGKSSRLTILIAKLNAKLSGWVPDSIVCCAERARAVHAGIGYRRDKMVVIPNGYDLEMFCPDAGAREKLRADWGVGPNIFLIGMVSRLDPQKDHGNLLSALEVLARLGVPFMCVLVGHGLGAENVEFASVVEEKGLQPHVLLLGQRTDIPAVMSALDLHVLSSRSEAFPNVLAEAMACGTPCVSTDVGDAGLILGDTGWIVPARDGARLAEAVVLAYEEHKDENKWRGRQIAARVRVEENFSVERMVQAYRSVWNG